MTRREAAAAVGVHRNTALDWDAGVRKSHGRRVYPDGRVVGGYNQAMDNTAGMGLFILEKEIDARFLSLEERETIRDLRAAGSSVRAIAAVLKRSPSTVSREIARNSDPVRGYEPYAAHRKAALRRPRPKEFKLARCGKLRRHVQAKLDLRLSPEQIHATLEMDFPDEPEMRVSPETIYKSVYRSDGSGLRRDSVPLLRTGRIRRRRRRNPQERRPRFSAPMVMIQDRPAVIEDRQVPGHWEGDLIKGCGNRSAIGTLIERTTRFLILLHLPDGHSSEEVCNALVAAFDNAPSNLRGSLTWDQGAEMAGHDSFTSKTGMPVYFCERASPWQRGSNENMNGLLRQYFPKSTDLSVHGLEELQRVAHQLNFRPRKTLGWDTPAQRLEKLAAISGSFFGL
ncbi:IS30 family transposase [Sinomonas mesophila]|uniref:IS30 family transposase n=1 Tax=Sinomonas mesophila TaxID=1531955 RepID=UPI001FE2F240|nr:IS30 family transposase [Sinomonas mesophila]